MHSKTSREIGLKMCGYPSSHAIQLLPAFRYSEVYQQWGDSTYQELIRDKLFSKLFLFNQITQLIALTRTTPTIIAFLSKNCMFNFQNNKMYRKLAIFIAPRTFSLQRVGIDFELKFELKFKTIGCLKVLCVQAQVFQWVNVYIGKTVRFETTGNPMAAQRVVICGYVVSLFLSLSVCCASLTHIECRSSALSSHSNQCFENVWLWITFSNMLVEC